jgi:IMP dehydrogenase
MQAVIQAVMEEYLAFDDVLLVPGRSTIVPGDANLSMPLAKGIRLHMPIVSAAMDTVTESRMAIALAGEGGLGIIHRNCPIANQAHEVAKVKSAEVGSRAATDRHGRLLVGAAIGVGADMEERLAAVAAAGSDVVCLDTAHGHSLRVIEATGHVKSLYPGLIIVAGNVVTAEGTRDLIAAGADAVKVGVGAGSICTTRVVAGVGVPQFSAIIDCAKAASVPIIADGGIRYSGDIVKALAAGASFVMLGNLLAGLEESPGETIELDSRRYKQYRGMGSADAMKGYAADRYNPSERAGGSGVGSAAGKLVPEGIEGRVPFRGHLADQIFQLAGGIRSGMGYVGAATIPELWAKAHFVRITNAGYVESHPHSVIIAEETPNCQPPASQK